MNSESAKQLDKTLEKSSKLKGAIDSSLDEMQTTFSRTIQSIQEKEQEINGKLDGANQALKDMQTRANQSITAMTSEVQRATFDVDATYQKLETFCTYMIIASSCLLVRFLVFCSACWVSNRKQTQSC